VNDKTSSAQGGGTAFGDNAHDNIVIKGDVGGNVIVTKQAQAIEPTSFHQVPPPPRDFTGRAAEIKELLEALELGGVTISGLHGLGGVGKTTLALKLAELLEGRYPDAQFYLDLKGPSAQPTPAADALAHVIRAYHPTAKLPESLDDLRALYLSVLHGQRALLLMDNARNEHQVEPLIPPPGCLLMVTSRFHFTVPGLKVKNLDALLPEDSVKLLLEIAPRIGSEAAEIARLCGNLPLGLRLAASFLTTRANYKVAEYVRKLRESSTRLKLIEASLNLSYKLLSRRLQANWIALSVFPDSFDQRAAAAIWRLDEEQTLERLGDLLNFSLVEWSEETDRYRLHDLARVFADSRAAESERLTYHQRHAEHYLQVLNEAAWLYSQGGEALKEGLTLFDKEWNNAQAGWKWVTCSADAIPRALELCSEYPDLCAHIAELRQRPRECITWREVALSAAQRLGRLDSQCVQLCNLGTSYLYLGDYRRAIEFFEQSLAIAREIGKRDYEGAMISNLGIAYQQLGEAERAIEYFEQSLPICRETGGRSSEGNAIGNMGIAYMDLGETHRAIECYEQSLAIYRQVGDRVGEAAALANLGEIYNRSLDDPQRAIDFYEKCLVIVRDVGARRSEGIALLNAARALSKMGDHPQAITYAEAALVIFDQIEDPETAVARQLLEALRWLHKYEEEGRSE
jgi:tetratricopeptide (TPR) repeat protein